jgi:homoserine kinase type II
MNPSLKFLQSILDCWNLTCTKAQPEIPIQGSPERSLDRIVLDAGEKRYLLEEICASSLPHKILIAERVALLAARGLPVAAPVAGPNGKLIQHALGQHWQLTEFLAGVELDHESYWRETWRGEALAHFLVDMRRVSRDMAVEKEEVFDLGAYAKRIAHDAKRMQPKIFAQLAPLFALIDRRLPPDLPVAFCHGDPHPQNMIWGTDRILGAIDWEFSGPKCVLHDMALIVGCVGSEDEDALNGPLVTAFLDTLRSCDELTPALEQHLPAWTLALRTAWLAEWLRREDAAMIEFEVFYMKTLAERFFGK